MAMRYGYFDSEITGVDSEGMPIFDRAETSELFRLLFAKLLTNGVLALPGDCFQVVAGSSGLTVKIRPGFGLINGAFAYDGAEETYALATAPTQYSRIDRVVLRCNYLERLCEIIVKTGTPAANPVPPELLQPSSGDYYELGLALVSSKDFLLTVLEGVRQIAEEYGIIINEKKTRICKLSSFYRYLQIGYSLTDTGRVIRKIHPKAVTRERRKLKAYKRKLDAGEMSYFDVENSFKSWLGGNWKRMSRQQISNMSLLYYQLFGRRPTWKKGHSRLRWLMGQPWRDSPSTATTTSATRKSPRTSSGTTSAK